MQGCHRKRVSVFGGILSLLPSVCRMQSSPETPTCGILTSTSLDRAMCLSSFFLDLLMVSSRLELCNSFYRATNISGARLDCIFISSGHVVGGRWSEETKAFLWSLACEKSRSEARVLRGSVCLLACAAAKAVAMSLLERRGVPGVGDKPPSAHEVVSPTCREVQVVGQV